MSGQPVVLAESGLPWPPSVEDFFLPSVVPGWAPFLTKVTLMVWFAVAILLVFFLVAYRKPQLVPTRMQWMAESLYGFVRTNVVEAVVGEGYGARFAPYLTTLFSFILVTNIFAIVPFLQLSPNSHIAFPVVLAVISWVMFIYLGVRKHGFGGYMKMVMVPAGAPWWALPLLTPIEIFSTLISRPITLSIRLFANMFAGHLILLVFTLGGILLLTSGNILYMGVSVLSLAMAIALTLLEFFIACLQAYVFVVLSASYFGGALADEH